MACLIRPQNFGQLSHYARKALRRIRKRSSLVIAFWRQAELFSAVTILCRNAIDLLRKCSAGCRAQGQKLHHEFILRQRKLLHRLAIGFLLHAIDN
jgi:hypothetical protein